jgi:hypothetical protein
MLHGRFALTWTTHTASPAPCVTSEEPSEPSTDPFALYVRHLAAQVRHLAAVRPGNAPFLARGGSFAIVWLTSAWQAAFGVPDLADDEAHPRSPDEVARRTCASLARAAPGELDSDAPLLYSPE